MSTNLSGTGWIKVKERKYQRSSALGWISLFIASEVPRAHLEPSLSPCSSHRGATGSPEIQNGVNTPFLWKTLFSGSETTAFVPFTSELMPLEKQFLCSISDTMAIISVMLNRGKALQSKVCFLHKTLQKQALKFFWWTCTVTVCAAHCRSLVAFIQFRTHCDKPWFQGQD